MFYYFLIVNAMTIARMILAAFVFLLLREDYPVYALLLVSVAALLDFDGKLARRWKVTTRFGAFLDPLADKVLILTVIGGLLVFRWLPDANTIWLYSAFLPTLVIFVREAAMIVVPVSRFLRGGMVRKGWFEYNQKESDARPPVSDLGKIKMVVQSIAVTLLVGALSTTPSTLWWVTFLGSSFAWVGMIVYWIAAYLTLITGLEYLVMEYPRLTPRVKPVIDSLRSFGRLSSV